MLAPPPGACFTTHRNHELRARASQLRAWLGRAAKVPANVPVVLVNVSADDELEQKLGELQRQQNVRLSPGTLSQKGGFLEAGFDFDGFLRAPKAYDWSRASTRAARLLQDAGLARDVAAAFARRPRACDGALVELLYPA